MRRVVLLMSALWPVFIACGGPEASVPPTPGHGDYLIEGRLFNAETGAPVSRKNVYVHVFNDAIDHQVSLELLEEATFAVRMPQAEVRLRVADGTHRHFLYEKRVTFEKGANVHDVALEPTHYVRLFGHLVDDETGNAVPRAKHREVFGGPLLLYVGDREGTESRGPIWPDDDGGYEVRMPRSVVEFAVVSTPESLVVNEVDLTNVEGDAFGFDLRIR